MNIRFENIFFYPKLDSSCWWLSPLLCRISGFDVVPFSFLLLVFWCQIQKIIAKTNVREFFPIFCRSFMIESLIHFELIFVYDRRVQFHSFACGYPVSPKLFIEKTIFSPLISKINWQYIWVDLFIDFLFCFIDLCGCF